MAAKKTATEEAVQEAAAAEVSFSKNQLRNCREFRNRKDLLNVILKDDQMYTKSEVRKLIKKFLNRPVGNKKKGR